MYGSFHAWAKSCRPFIANPGDSDTGSALQTVSKTKAAAKAAAPPEMA
jgi:hypothetical protein